MCGRESFKLQFSEMMRSKKFDFLAPMVTKVVLVIELATLDVTVRCSSPIVVAETQVSLYT